MLKKPLNTDKLISITRPKTNTQYHYDDNGNPTQIDTSSQGQTNSRKLTYTADGQIKSITDSQNKQQSKQTVEYGYNHNRQRVRKTQGDSQTNYLWQQGLLDAEITDGRISRRYLYLGLRPIAVIDYDQDNKASIYSIHTDYLGTPKQIIDQKQQIVWQAAYDDFGQISSKQTKDNFEFNLRFAGQYEDSESGYYYNWHRYYNPETGRYLTSDPIGLAGGLNTYVYANQSPSMGVDPWGLYSVSAGGKTTFYTNFKFLKEFTIDTLDGWEDYKSSDEYYHEYNKSVVVNDFTATQAKSMEDYLV